MMIRTNLRRCLKPNALCRKLHFTISLNNESKAKGGAPLSGVRVLDLTRVLAGPFASMLLGDLGAEVVKVEKPGEGDDTRTWGPPFVGSESTYFLSVNRNKKSIAIDFKNPKGAEIIKELTIKSDVLLENYLPGKLDKLGLGYETLKKYNPSLVYCSITGYGPGGPYDQRAGYDVIVSAVGGLMNITGPEDGDPCKSGVALIDLVTGLYAHGAVMAALIERQKTGQGQKIDCSLLASQVAVLSHVATSYLNTGFKTGRYGTAHHSIVPYQAFKTKDGHLLVGAGNDGLFKKLCQVLDVPNLSKDNRFQTNDKRVLNRKILIDVLEKRFQNKTTKEWLYVLEDSGIPYGPINDVEQVFEDPQVKYKEMVQEMAHPTLGRVKVPGPAVEYNGKTSSFAASSPPLLGQHTKEILRDILCYDDEQISNLLHSKCIVSHDIGHEIEKNGTLSECGKEDFNSEYR